MHIVEFVLEWVQTHPGLSGLAAAAFVVLVWWMRRPDPVLREGNREFDRLTNKNRGKYDKLRPL